MIRPWSELSTKELTGFIVCCFFLGICFTVSPVEANIDSICLFIFAAVQQKATPHLAAAKSAMFDGVCCLLRWGTNSANTRSASKPKSAKAFSPKNIALVFRRSINVLCYHYQYYSRFHPNLLGTRYYIGVKNSQRFEQINIQGYCFTARSALCNHVNEDI